MWQTRVCQRCLDVEQGVRVSCTGGNGNTRGDEDGERS